jgi:hypothetical protein
MRDIVATLTERLQWPDEEVLQFDGLLSLPIAKRPVRRAHWNTDGFVERHSTTHQ